MSTLSTKLPHYPKFVFKRGRSGHRFVASDIPTLQALRAAYQKLVLAIDSIDWQQEGGPLEVRAALKIRREIIDNDRACCQALKLLQRTPRAWLP